MQYAKINLISDKKHDKRRVKSTLDGVKSIDPDGLLEILKTCKKSFKKKHIGKPWFGSYLKSMRMRAIELLKDFRKGKISGQEYAIARNAFHKQLRLSEQNHEIEQVEKMAQEAASGNFSNIYIKNKENSCLISNMYLGQIFRTLKHSTGTFLTNTNV